MEPTPILERARNYVAKMPAAISGSGGHDATFHVACVLVQGFALSLAEAESLLAEYNARCEPPWSERELQHKLRQAEGMPGLKTQHGIEPRGCLAKDLHRDDAPAAPALPSRAPSSPAPKAAPTKPEFSPEKLRLFAARWREFIDTVWLADRSQIQPYRLTGLLTADEFLRAVFREGERVVVFTNQRSQGQAIWPLQAIPEGGDEGVWFLAQPVDGRSHPNPREEPNEDGTPKMSRRAEESVVDWRHLVLESDQADARDWMAALVQLPLRIVAIYTSGGRSIHALVRVDAKSKQDWDNVVKQIRPALVTLGADPRAMSAVRLTRLPGCLRGDRLQKLLYLNPSPTPEPLCRRPRLHRFLEEVERMAAAATNAEPAAVFDAGEWPLVEQVHAALKWFESSSRARQALSALEAWMEGGAGK